MPAQWTLPEDHVAAGAARRHVAAELANFANIDDIELVASELATNAVEHGGPPIVLALDLHGGLLRLSVTSASLGATPHIRTSAVDDENGRGLAIVNGLSEQWGWESEDGRIRVWADFIAE